MRPGPENIEEKGNCPLTLAEDMFGSYRRGGELRRRRVKALLELGEMLHTDFSGVLGPEIAKQMQKVTINHMRFDMHHKNWLHVWRSSDVDKTCLLVQCKSKNVSIKHIFKDLTIKTSS